jgi:membrane protease YdiL (CAAX protease family)
MILIVLLYEPLAWGLDFPVFGYMFWKFVLFVFLPLGILYWRSSQRGIKSILIGLGVKRENAGESLKLALFLLPLMLGTSAAVSFWLGRLYPPSDITYTGIMFIESFTEEFFFRGILFLYLWKITDIRVAYVTSIACFVLVHPQYFWGLGMLAVLVQGILTAIIAHKSKNLTGAWALHGADRMFSLSILPWFL